MKRTPRRTPTLSPEQSDIAVSFYDAALRFPRKPFGQIAKRLVPEGFGKLQSSGAFKKEVRKMLNLAH